jgi:hypothetical protein
MEKYTELFATKLGYSTLVQLALHLLKGFLITGFVSNCGKKANVTLRLLSKSWKMKTVGFSSLRTFHVRGRSNYSLERDTT